MILGAYNPACLLSLSGFVAAIAAIVLSSTGEIELALVCLMLAGLADLFDGFVARRLNRSAYERRGPARVPPIGVGSTLRWGRQFNVKNGLGRLGLDSGSTAGLSFTTPQDCPTL